MSNFRINKVYIRDCIKFMKKIPSGSVDLAFADPPYNLQKGYSSYKDNKSDLEYIKWCNDWLEGMARIIKETGSLYVLNIPKWSVHHAVFLDKILYRQNWITWDALSEPRGKLMPAHYSLLFYTKDKRNYVFNKLKTENTYDSCYRASCIKKRRNIKGTFISDIWFDLHRIRHRKKRDSHPCQLPLKLLERIILSSTNRGGLVFDPFMGVGTTAIVSKLLGRNYLGYEIDRKYSKILKEKLVNFRDFITELETKPEEAELFTT